MRTITSIFLLCALLVVTTATLNGCDSEEETPVDVVDTGDTGEDSTTLGQLCEPTGDGVDSPCPLVSECHDWQLECALYCHTLDGVCRQNGCYQGEEYDYRGYCEEDENGNPRWVWNTSHGDDVVEDVPDVPDVSNVPDVLDGDDVPDGDDDAPSDSSDGVDDVPSDTVDSQDTGDVAVTSVRGSCETVADCSGGECVPLSSGDDAWHVCAADVTPSVGTCDGPMDACCADAECTDGTDGGCFEGPLWYCGGAAPQPATLCVYDACATATECTGTGAAVCVPEGAFGEQRSRCVYGDCVVDSECGSRDGGLCLPFFDPCNNRLDGFFCTYADSACRADGDCSGGDQYCAHGADGVTTCETFYPRP